MKHLYLKNNKLFAQLNYSENFFDDYMKHSHDMLALSVVKKGQIKINYLKDEFEILNINNIAIFNPNEVHLSKKVKENTKDYYTLYLDVNWCIDLQNELKLNTNSFLEFNTHVIKDEVISNELLNICEDINNNISHKYEQKIKSVMVKLFNDYTNKNNTIIKEKELANNIKLYIYDNIDNKINLDDISKYLAYDSRHIIRVFKKQFGLSPMAYIQNIKINSSKNLLLNDNSLCDTANKSGFYDQSHFSKNFKKVFAITPGKYKS